MCNNGEDENVDEDKDGLLRLERKRLRPSLNQRPLVVRVYQGGMNCPQYIPFKRAMDNVKGLLINRSIRVDYITLHDMRESTWTLKQFGTHLLESHSHFIITHVHQGMHNFGWSIEEIYNEISKLEHHIGFPMGDKLRCPVFTQDKFQYLEALSHNNVMQSYKIQLSQDMDMNELARRINR